MLVEEVDPNVQREAAWALGSISHNVMANATKIGTYPHTIERLVGLLGEGVRPDVQNQAAWALGSLSQDVMKNAVKIGYYPGAIGRLVRLLSEERNTQKNGARALWYICCSVPENESLLRRTLLEAPPALKSLTVVTVGETYPDWHLQYWSALVYEMFNSENAEVRQIYRSSTAYEGKGDATVNIGEYNRALEAYENALSIEKVDRLVRKRCFAKAKLGDFVGALMDINDYIQSGDDRPLGLQERGVLKCMMGDLNGALADLDEGLQLQTDDYERLKHRGLVKSLLKDKDGARIDAEWALRIKPARVDSHRYGRCPCLGVSSVEY